MGLLILGLLLSAFFGSAQESNSLDEPIGLNVGDTVTFFSAQNQFDSTFVLAEALADGLVIVVFYRGQWCPYCNRHLSELQENLELIEERGATIIAISPENQEGLNKTKEKSNLEFTLLSDENYDICRAFDVLFVPSKADVKKYNAFLRADLENAHSNENILLPVPATFIIDQNGIIVWRQFDEDYKQRSTVEEIIKNL
ncbi:MAG: peroxiredoxin-like family protein [Crocinitomicaceae bacterium]|nr:peroxiredoxin-like family protein [Crocinitomicaceae bacterium]